MSKFLDNGGVLPKEESDEVEDDDNEDDDVEDVGDDADDSEVCIFIATLYCTSSVKYKSAPLTTLSLSVPVFQEDESAEVLTNETSKDEL